MKICNQCGQRCKDSESFCNNCGGYLPPVKKSKWYNFSGKVILIVAIVFGLALIGTIFALFLPKTKEKKVERYVTPTIEDCYVPQMENIVYLDKKESYGYVNNMVLAYFAKDTSEDRIQEIIDSVNGTVVGKIPGLGQYQIEVSAASLEQLEDLCTQIQTCDEVLFAVTDHVYTVDSNTITVPNDPWESSVQSMNDGEWDEEHPEGSNWWAEAIKMPSAWSYESYFSNISVGVVDNGFDVNHEDLDIDVINWDVNDVNHEPWVQSHGTHVAGVIGATGNNGVGITGILQNVNLYGVDCYATNDQVMRNITVSSLVDSIDTCITKYDCRVVNLSSGTIYENPDITPDVAEICAYDVALNLIMMLYNYENDFIIVQSAGNGDKNGNGVDSGLYNGYYASLTETVFESAYNDVLFYNPGVTLDITYEDVMNSILVVGAVDVPDGSGEYQLSQFSNYGDAVSVCAPGVGIYSTIVTNRDGSYGYMDGTSMAAPITAGVTALVWSVDQTMTAGQVKDIIISTATEPVRPRSSGDYGTYYMLDAKAAVEKAIELSQGSIENEEIAYEDDYNDTWMYDMAYEMRNGAIEIWSEGEFLGGFFIEYPYFYGNEPVVEVINESFEKGFGLGGALANESGEGIEVNVLLDADPNLPYQKIMDMRVSTTADGYLTIYSEAVMEEMDTYYESNMNAVTYRISDGSLLTYSDILIGTDAQINALIKQNIEAIYGMPRDTIDILYIYDDFGLTENGVNMKVITYDGSYDLLISYTDMNSSIIDVSKALDGIVVEDLSESPSDDGNDIDNGKKNVIKR